MTTSPNPYSTRRARSVNFGDKMTWRGGEQQRHLAQISVDEARAWTVYVTASVAPLQARAVPIAIVEWGHGGASVVSREYRVYRRLRVPVVGSTVSVQGRILAPDGSALPTNTPVTCRFAAFIAEGSDGETLRNTRWISQHGAQGVISTGPEQLVTVQGYPAAPGPRWLMLFDAPQLPANGTFPAMATQARRSFRLDRFDTQGFRWGIAWAASSTPMTFTLDPGADLRVDVEVLT